VLTDSVSLGLAPDMLFQLFSYITGGERRQKAKALAAGEDPDGDAKTLDVLARAGKISRHKARPGSLRSKRSILWRRGSTPSPRRPRSPPTASPLTIDAVRYAVGKARPGRVASTFFAERIPPGTRNQGLYPEAHAFGLRPIRRCRLS